MITQAVLSLLLSGIVIYAWAERRRSPLVGLLSMFAALAGMYLVWIPAHATALAETAGVGRGVDLILYIWVVISLLLFLNLHLKGGHHCQRLPRGGRERGSLRLVRPGPGSSPGQALMPGTP